MESEESVRCSHQRENSWFTGVSEFFLVSSSIEVAINEENESLTHTKKEISPSGENMAKKSVGRTYFFFFFARHTANRERRSDDEH